MKDYILSVTSIILLTTISGLILPKSKIGNTVKGVYCLVAIIVISSPILKLLKKDFNFNIQNVNQNILLQENFLNYVNYSKSNYLQETVNLYLKHLNYEDISCEIISNDSSESYKIDKVYLYFTNSGIIKDEEHKYNIEEVKQAVSKYLSIQISKVEIYEQTS